MKSNRKLHDRGQRLRRDNIPRNLLEVSPLLAQDTNATLAVPKAFDVMHVKAWNESMGVIAAKSALLGKATRRLLRVLQVVAERANDEGSGCRCRR